MSADCGESSAIQVRQISPDELVGVYDIDMTEDGNIIYSVVDGVLHQTMEEWRRPPRTRERWDQMIDTWRDILLVGGEAWGAFHADRMVGIAVLRYQLTDDMAELTALFVSRTFRRSGVACALVQHVLDAARETGAHRIYVSATPSRSAVGFYRSQGFELAPQVHPLLFALEPEDIHMIRPHLTK